MGLVKYSCYVSLFVEGNGEKSTGLKSLSDDTEVSIDTRFTRLNILRYVTMYTAITYLQTPKPRPIQTPKPRPTQTPKPRPIQTNSPYDVFT